MAAGRGRVRGGACTTRASGATPSHRPVRYWKFGIDPAGAADSKAAVARRAPLPSALRRRAYARLPRYTYSLPAALQRHCALIPCYARAAASQARNLTRSCRTARREGPLSHLLRVQRRGRDRRRGRRVRQVRRLRQVIGPHRARRNTGPLAREGKNRIKGGGPQGMALNSTLFSLRMILSPIPEISVTGTIFDDSRPDETVIDSSSLVVGLRLSFLTRPSL